MMIVLLGWTIWWDTIEPNPALTAHKEMAVTVNDAGVPPCNDSHVAAIR